MQLRNNTMSQIEPAAYYVPLIQMGGYRKIPKISSSMYIYPNKDKVSILVPKKPSVKWPRRKEVLKGFYLKITPKYKMKQRKTLPVFICHEINNKLSQSLWQR